MCGIPNWRYTRQGYQNTVSEARPDGLRTRIVCCIKFRLIESFQWHRHTDNRAAALRYPQIPLRYRQVSEGCKEAKCGSRGAISDVFGAAGKYFRGSILRPVPARR